jgi:non-specific serine/threonine protein kinase
LNLARAMDIDWAIAQFLEAYGTAVREQGDYRRAAPLFAESLTSIRDSSDSQTGGHCLSSDSLIGAHCLKNLGAVAAVIGSAEQAARLFGSAQALYDRHGFVFAPPEQARMERAIAPARARLSEASFTAAWSAGRAMPVEQAVAEALAVAAAATAVTPRNRRAPTDLTRRERDVLRLLAAGHANRAIGDLLSISERTVENHVFHILTKLGVESRSAAASYAVRHGLD